MINLDEALTIDLNPDTRAYDAKIGNDAYCWCPRREYTSVYQRVENRLKPVGQAGHVSEFMMVVIWHYLALDDEHLPKQNRLFHLYELP